MVLNQRNLAGKQWKVKIEKFALCDGCCGSFEAYTPTYWSSENRLCFECATKAFSWAPNEPTLNLEAEEKKKIISAWESKARKYFAPNMVKKLRKKLF